MKIKNFNDYEIYPEEGKIWSYKSQRFIGYPNADGYWKVTMHDDNGKKHNFKLHRVIYTAVHGDIPENYEINHLDENPSNNVITNLSACSHLENIRYGTRTARQRAKMINGKRSKKVGAYKDNVLVMVFPSASEAGRHGFNHSHVSQCCNGKLPHHKRYQWRYLN